MDEAGRGPLAGPVVAAAVILPFGEDIPGVRDSKTLDEAARQAAFELIARRALAWAWAAAGAGEIDRINILRASLLAMRRAVRALGVPPDFLIIDGNQTIDLRLAQRAVPKADALSHSVSAASIVAKVVRDRMMVRLDRVFPGYDFSVHKGYGTKAHQRALARLGPCWLHRRTFAGVCRTDGD